MAKLELSGISKLGGYLLSNRGPLDKRTVVPEYSNLNDLATDYYIYPGIIVYVQAEDKHYTYALNPEYVESLDNPNEDGKYIWKEFNGTEFEVEPIIAELEGRVTVITYNITKANTEVDFKYGLPGMTRVEWGDGIANTELSHTYTEIGEYKCRIYDLTELYLATYGPPETWSKGVTCITAITLGKTVTSIKGIYQTTVTEFIIPDSVTSIGDNAFYHCSSLTSVEIGNSVRSIGEYAFRNCGITSIVIPDSVTSIGDWAFSGCSSLTSVIIGNSVNSIGSSAFLHCSSLMSIIIPNSVTSIGSSAFDNCDSLTSVVIGDGVTSISNGMFSNCDNLTSVVIGKSINNLILNSVLTESPFYNCPSLQRVVFRNTLLTELIATYAGSVKGYLHVFSECPITEIYVPCGCVNSYKTAWTKRNVPQEFVNLISTKGNFSDLVVGWDTMLVLDGGDADVQLAVLDKTILK